MREHFLCLNQCIDLHFIVDRLKKLMLKFSIVSFPMQAVRG